jgi:ribosomal RNA-processing protein 36
VSTGSSRPPCPILKMPRRPRPAKRKLPRKLQPSSDFPKPNVGFKFQFTKPDSKSKEDGGSDLDEGESSFDEFEEGSSQGSITRHGLEEGEAGEDDDADAPRVVQWAEDGEEEFQGDDSEDEEAGSEISAEVCWGSKLLK